MLKVIAGPCAIEDEEEFVEIAVELAEIATQYPVELIIKGSFDKANRTFGGSPRGVGLDRGLEALDKAANATLCPVTTDVHEVWQVEEVASVVEVIQIPAFLCRQTDLLSAAGASGAQVNVKRGQFTTVREVQGIMSKVPEAWITFRGLHYGPGNRVVCDVGEMMATAGVAHKSILDVTHTNNGIKTITLGLTKCARALLYDGIFAEVHPDVSRAISDGKNQLSYDEFRWMLDVLCL